MNDEQRERLEQELKFLEESLEADVISKDEYGRGKERIEKKLKEIEERPEEKAEEKKEEIEEEKEEKKEEVQEPNIEIKEIKEKPTQIIGIEEEEPKEERLLKSKISKGFEKSKTFQNKPEEKEEKEETGEERKPEEAEEEKEEEITISKKWLYGIAILIIAAILFFSMRGCRTGEENTIEEELIEEFIPECSSNSDCKQAGMVGICLSPGTKEAKCEFKEDARTELVLINDKDCKLCDSSSMKTIIRGIFPNVKIRDIDYGAAEAKELVEELNINALPAYIFDSNVGKTINFNDFKSALIKKENNYVMTKTASGASYYFKRPLIKNNLDLYVLPGANGKIEASVQEVLDLFKDKINFTKHIVTEGQEEVLEKELGINTYPTFLLNNQLKFRGILPANTIKEKICEVNSFEECGKELSKV